MTPEQAQRILAVQACERHRVRCLWSLALEHAVTCDACLALVVEAALGGAL